MGHGAGGILVDAAADALDHGDRAPCRRLPVADAGQPLAGRELALPEAFPSALPSEPGIAGAARNAAHHAVNWLELATVIYAIIAGVLLLRLAIGLYLTWRLVPRRDSRCARHGRPARSIRVSGLVGGPVTFGSTIRASARLRRLGWAQATGGARP